VPITAPTTMTPVGTWTLEPAANLTFNKQISADVTTAYDALSVVFQLQLSSSAGIQTINQMSTDTIPSTPAVVDLFKFDADDTASYPVVLEQLTASVASVAIPRSTNKNYTITVNSPSVQSCDQVFVECLEYTGDLGNTWWDTTVNTAFAANSSTLPTATPVRLTQTMTGNMAVNSPTFTFTHNNVAPGTETYTYVLRARPATVTALINDWVPETFYRIQTITDPGPPVTTSVSTIENYRVITLT
jgi:hypothetical protein